MVHELAQMSQEELSVLTKKANQVKQSFLLKEELKKTMLY